MPRVANVERDAAILADRKAGLSVKALARKWGLSPSRVDKILGAGRAVSPLRSAARRAALLRGKADLAANVAAGREEIARGLAVLAACRRRR